MDEGHSLRGLIYKQEGNKFLFKLYIEETPNKFIYLNVQETWPGPGKRIFCQLVGDCGIADLPTEEPIEKCNIIKQHRYGKRLIIILDRKIKKRCWFVFLKKEYKKKPGKFYYQVFWIT